MIPANGNSSMKSKKSSFVVAIATVSMYAAATLSPAFGGMPSPQAVAEVRPIVNELMKPYIDDCKAGKKTALDVGDEAMRLVGEADGDAAKFVLLKGAVAYYARAKEYDGAADAIEAIVALAPDVPPKVLCEIVSGAAEGANLRKAPRLAALNDMAKNRLAMTEKRAKMAKGLKAKPDDQKLKRQCAELSVLIDGWDAAIMEFAALDGKVGEMAVAETTSSGKTAELADFWWSYEPVEMDPNVLIAIRAHAAGLYKKAIDGGELDGLKKVLAQRRIEEVEAAGKRPSADSAAGDVEASTASSADENLQEGLVGYWRFDGNAKDSSLRRNHGILRGVKPAPDRFGRKGKAFYFNGKSHVEVPNSPSLQRLKKAITVSVWIKPIEWAGIRTPLMQKGDRFHSQFTIDLRNGECMIGSDVNDCDVRAPHGLLELNKKWFHIVATCESGQNFRVYNNGVLAGTGDVAVELVDNCLPLLIGTNSRGEATYFTGFMDDVRIYRRALSEQEIQALYKAESSPR